MKFFADKKRREIAFKPKEWVLLSTANLNLAPKEGKKLQHKFIGPFQIKRKIG